MVEPLHGLDHFPNLTAVANTLWRLGLSSVKLPGPVTHAMVRDLKKLKNFSLWNTQIHEFDVSFCHCDGPVAFHLVKNANLYFMQNPYLNCLDRLDSFSYKPAVSLTGSNISCDSRHCWMKKFASKLEVVPFTCSDGRKWADLTLGDICSGE